MCHTSWALYNNRVKSALTLILLTWKIGWAPNNASIWQMGFNSAFKGLSLISSAMFWTKNKIHTTHNFSCHFLISSPQKPSTLELTCLWITVHCHTKHKKQCNVSKKRCFWIGVMYVFGWSQSSK
jgi:hypothetical protein